VKRGPFSRQGGREDAEEGSQRGTDSLGAMTGRRRGKVGGGLSPAGDQRADVLHEVPELRQLKEENTKLKPLVADLSLYRHMLQEILRNRLKSLRSERGVSRLLPIPRSTLRYQSHRDRQAALRMRLRELAASRVRFGYRRLTVLLRQEGWPVNAKRICRLYTEEGLTVRTKQRKKAASRQRVPLGIASPASAGAWTSSVTDSWMDVGSVS
jgi:putative transposase